MLVMRLVLTMERLGLEVASAEVLSRAHFRTRISYAYTCIGLVDTCVFSCRAKRSLSPFLDQGDEMFQWILVHYS